MVRHGFDREQVRQRVDELAATLERAATERAEATAQVAELRGELEIARREITALNERLDSQGDDESAARLLAVAKSQAAEVTSRAKAAAEQAWAAAEKASTELRDQQRAMLASLEQQHEELNRTHKSMLASAKAQSEKMTSEAERHQEAIDKAAERDRIRIDREFSESMTTKREALRRELDTARKDSEREVTTRLAAADQEARRRVDAVSAQVNELMSVRGQLSNRLRETKELLDQSASLLEPVEGESEVEELKPPAKDKRAVPPQRQPAKTLTHEGPR